MILIVPACEHVSQYCGVCDWGVGIAFCDGVLFPDDVRAEARNSDVADYGFGRDWGAGRRVAAVDQC